MSEPKTYEEYLTRTKENTVISGFGIGNVYTDVPCPFCAAPNFMRYEIMEVKQVTAQEHVCKECGRGSKFIITEKGPSMIAELVQTCGPDQPDYFTHKMRRITVCSACNGSGTKDGQPVTCDCGKCEGLGYLE